MSQRLFVTALGLGALLLIVTPVWAGDPAPSNAEVLSRATDELTAAFGKLLPDSSASEQKISLRADGQSSFNGVFQDALAPYLLDRGWDVWILEAGEEPGEGSLLLEYQVLQASLRYPSQSHGFLGLGTPKIKRQVDLQVQAQLDEPTSGQIFWLESPEAHYKDSFPAAQKSAVEAEQPAWLGTTIPIEQGADSGAGFWEKIAILGLIGGVVVLYVSGAG